MVDLLVIKIGTECFGIETAYVKTVTKNLIWPDHEHYPDFASDIVEYEGRKVVVVDLGMKTEKCRWSDFIVVSCKDGEFVMLIDEVIDIFQVSEKDIIPIPVFAEKNMSENFFKGVFSKGNTLVLLLDVSKLLNMKDVLVRK